MSQAPLTRAYDEVVTFFAGAPTREQIADFKLSDQAKARVRELLRKNSEGILTPDEADDLDACVQLDRMVMLIRTRAREQAESAPGA